ncbi:GntR family transcriptional regulator [Citricoccus nitrophenolicus]
MKTASATPLMADQVFQLLRDQIVWGQLPPGSRLQVRDVAAAAGTSIMPVREAVRRLEEAGLVHTEPHKGAVVRELTVKELQDKYDVRLLLECEATRLGCSGISQRDIDRMEALCDQLESLIGTDRIAELISLHNQLVGILYERGDNHFLVQSIERLWDQCQPFRLLGSREAYKAHDDSPWRFQRQIVIALKARDFDRVVDLTRECIAHSRANIGHLIAAQTSPSDVALSTA